jgi:iron complex transport system ATP-binding protein
VLFAKKSSCHRFSRFSREDQLRQERTAVRARRWELDNVTFRVDGRALVQGVSLAVEPGSFVGVLGPNGSGKSTLLRLAAGFLAPAEGRVLLDGRALEDYSRRQAARRIAFVPQDTHVGFEFTAFEIALMGRHPCLGRFQWPRRRDHDVVRRAMKQTETEEFAQRSILTLSGGERQRVFLARALATESPFIALDEPTSNLDVEHALEFLSLAQELARERKRGILMAIHDLNWALRFCDETILLDKGKIAGRGAPGETLTPERIRQVFHVEARPLKDPEGRTVLAFQRSGSTVRQSRAGER